MGFLSDLGKFFGGGGGSDPSKAAEPYLSAIPGEIKPYYEPYFQAGTAELPQLQSQYASLMGDPTALINHIMSGYQESPGAKYNISQGIDAANRAAAAGGMAGTPESQASAMQVAQGLSAQDQQQYLQNALGMYRTGIAGAQGLAGMGQQAGQSLADQLANIAASQAQLAYSGAQQRNQSRSGLIGGLMGLLGSGVDMAASLFGPKSSGTGSETGSSFL